MMAITTSVPCNKVNTVFTNKCGIKNYNFCCSHIWNDTFSVDKLLLHLSSSQSSAVSSSVSLDGITVKSGLIASVVVFVIVLLCTGLLSTSAVAS